MESPSSVYMLFHFCRITHNACRLRLPRIWNPSLSRGINDCYDGRAYCVGPKLNAMQAAFTIEEMLSSKSTSSKRCSFLGPTCSERVAKEKGSRRDQAAAKTETSLSGRFYALHKYRDACSLLITSMITSQLNANGRFQIRPLTSNHVMRRRHALKCGYNYSVKH